MIVNTFPNVGNSQNPSQGSVKPGSTDIGYGFSPNLRERLKNVFVDVVEAGRDYYVGKVKAKADKSTKPEPARDYSKADTTTAVEVAQVTTDKNRQTVIIVVAAAIFISVMFFARKA